MPPLSRGDGQKGNGQVEKHHKSHWSNEDPIEGVFIGEVTDIAVRMRSDVDLSCVEPWVGEKAEHEEKRQAETKSEHEVKEPICPSDTLDRMEQTVRFNSCRNKLFNTDLCGENLWRTRRASIEGVWELQRIGKAMWRPHQPTGGGSARPTEKEYQSNRFLLGWNWL